MLQFMAYTICSLVYSLHRTKTELFFFTVIIELSETAKQHIPKPDICQLFNIWFPSNQETDQVSAEKNTPFKFVFVLYLIRFSSGDTAMWFF